ncbi:MAG: hypothetical protein KDK56_09160 [Simkania sp.]|nr:hypothetical protein [Simkania sp.]MCP5490618.1 hypothetical protein [Chlamydiales bacterium]
MITRLAIILCFLFSMMKLQAETVNLVQYEKKIFSQAGEDGVIEQIFNMIGISTKYYVEFGAIDGHAYSNTKYLREFKGWTGLLMDCDYEDLSINLHKHFITAENINELFELHNVPYDLDLLSIDIDGIDFYVWHALDEKYRPRLVVIEYNPNFPPPLDYVIPYNPAHQWDHTRYFGASISALYKLGLQKKYTLVYGRGGNLYFISDELVTASFQNANDIFKLYQNGFHVPDPKNRPLISSDEALRSWSERSFREN